MITYLEDQKEAGWQDGGKVQGDTNFPEAAAQPVPFSGRWICTESAIDVET